jgi:hypothetical protein
MRGSEYEQVLSILRGLFIYDETGHKSEFYFLAGFIGIDIVVPEYSYNYLLVGYLVIGVILWHQNESVYEGKCKSSMGKPLLMEMSAVVRRT